MTVKSDQRKIIYQGNGVTTQFAVPFYFINNADIQASVNDGTTTTDLVLGTDYTLTGAGVETGGTLTTVSPVASGSEIAILRTVAYKQEMDIPENDIFPSQNMERALDRLTMQTQQLKEQADRAVTVDIFSDADPSALVDKIEILYDIKDDLTTDAQNITAITTTAGNISSVNTVAGDSAEINALAEISTAISSCYSNMSAITDAPTQASNAASSASSASASATLAQKWAVDANLVASTDYSSKSWATGSLDAGSSKDWAIKEGGQVGTTGKYSAKVYSLAAQNHYEKAVDWASKTNGQVESTDYSAKAYAISEGLIAAGSAKEWSNKAKAWATSTTIVEDGKYGASYYALQAYNANVSAQAAKTTAQEWASKTDAQVASTDYSSKAYAQSEGLISSGSSKEWATKSATWAEGSDADVSALGGTHSAKGWADAAEDTYESVVGLIATPIGTIFQSIYVDESLDIARALNGQLISSTKFYGFRDWLDDVQTAHPSLFTTEVNWQAEVTNSVLGQCGKFVIDDNAGTIRLPKVINAQGLMDLQYLGTIKNESLPNITGALSVYWNIVGGASGSFSPASPNQQNTISGSQTTVDSAYNVVNFDASGSSSTYQNDAPVQQEAIQYPYYIQVATGVEETLPAIREYKVNNSDFFGKSMYSDVAPDNASWLVSNGSYNAKTVYPDYYDWLVSHIGETITANGGKVVLSTGTITDYDWVVNQSDETFRLPLLDGSEDVPSMSNYVDVALPSSGTTLPPTRGNGFYSILGYAANNDPSQTTPMYIALSVGGRTQRASGTTANALGVSLACGKGAQCYIEYSNFSITNQSYACFRYYFNRGNGSLYYYVGDTVQDASLINAGAVLGQLANKVDIDASNFNAAGRSYLAGMGMPDVAYAQFVSNSFASSTVFTAPASGWYCCRGLSSAAGHMAIFMASLDANNNVVAPYSGGTCYVSSAGVSRDEIFPVLKSTKITVQYSNCNLSGDAYCGLWFIPAKGEN